MAKIKKNGGCLCGKVRFKVHGEIVKSGVCHCRYCQLRSGSAFGIGVWFNIEDLTINKKILKSYQLITENKNKFKTFFVEIVEQHYVGHLVIFLKILL